MKIYNYRCLNKKCGKYFEWETEKSMKVKCSFCNSTRVKKVIIHAPKITFVGSGWGKDK